MNIFHFFQKPPRTFFPVFTPVSHTGRVTIVGAESTRLACVRDDESFRTENDSERNSVVCALANINRKFNRLCNSKIKNKIERDIIDDFELK